MENPYDAPQSKEPPKPSPQTGSDGETTGDGTGGIIPYKNPQALLAYYLGLFGLFPCIGIVLSIPAVVLGVRGLQARKRNPVIRGAAHAWIGIVLGSICSLCHLAGWTMIIVGIVSEM